MRLSATRAPQVRLQLTSTAGRLAGQDTLPLLHNLMGHVEDCKDPYIPLMIWLAYEPRVLAQRDAVLDWMKQHAPANLLVANEILPRTMRRLAATGRTEDLAACIHFVGLLDDGTRFRKPFRRLSGDRGDLRIDRRDAEIRRIGDALRLFARPRRRQK